MKATGIVRRIDDLGRVVIPKEIRRTMRIRVGFTFESGVIFQAIAPLAYSNALIQNIILDLKYVLHYNYSIVFLL